MSSLTADSSRITDALALRVSTTYGSSTESYEQALSAMCQNVADLIDLDQGSSRIAAPHHSVSPCLTGGVIPTLRGGMARRAARAQGPPKDQLWADLRQKAEAAAALVTSTLAVPAYLDASGKLTGAGMTALSGVLTAITILINYPTAEITALLDDMALDRKSGYTPQEDDQFIVLLLADTLHNMVTFDVACRQVPHGPKNSV